MAGSALLWPGHYGAVRSLPCPGGAERTCAGTKCWVINQITCISARSFADSRPTSCRTQRRRISPKTACLQAGSRHMIMRKKYFRNTRKTRIRKNAPRKVLHTKKCADEKMRDENFHIRKKSQTKKCMNENIYNRRNAHKNF